MLTTLMLRRMMRHLVVSGEGRRRDLLWNWASWEIGLDWIDDLEYYLVLTLVWIRLTWALVLERRILGGSEACCQVRQTTTRCVGLPKWIWNSFISWRGLEMWRVLLLGWITRQRIALNVHTVWLLHKVREHLVVNQLLLETIVISHSSSSITLILIENVLRVHHIWLEGMIVVGVLMMCLHLLLHALTQVHDLQLDLLLVLLLSTIVRSSWDPSLSVRSLIVTLPLISVVIISIVFIWVRRRWVILAALAVLKSWHPSCIVGEDHWMWILEIWRTGWLREIYTRAPKCLSLEVRRYRRCQRYWWIVILLKCRSSWIILSWAVVWTIITKGLEVTVELLMRQSSKIGLYTSRLDVIVVSCGCWDKILKITLWLWVQTLKVVGKCWATICRKGLHIYSLSWCKVMYPNTLLA